MARKNTFSKKIEFLDAQEEDDNGFIEGDVKTGKVFASFNFAPQPADGESHTVNRFYKIRYSTAKMLNEIKASHPDVNVYMNSIVDEAIRHYHSFIFNKE
jgi:hypothetical protein